MNITRSFEGAPRVLFAQDLPAGRIRQQLAPVLEMRALTPQVMVKCRRTTLSKSNASGKVVTRVQIDSLEAAPTWVEANGKRRSRPTKLPVRVRVITLRGYESAAKKICRSLTANSDFRPVREDWVIAAYHAASHPLGIYKPNPQTALEPSARADIGVKKVLHTILGTLEANIPGLMDDVDSEFLHDFRVAIRRSRAILRMVKGVLPASQVEYFAGELRHLGQLTSPPRDNDVLLLKLDDYLARLVTQQNTDTASLKLFLEEERVRVYRHLLSELRTKRFRAFLRRWRHFLEKPVPERPSAPRAKQSLRDVIQRDTWRTYRRLRKRGDTINAQSPAEDLHEVRKDAKRLRYLIGLFRDIHDPKHAGLVVRELKKLQEVLGTFQDREAHSMMLSDRGDGLRADSRTPTDTLMLMGRLVDLLDADQQEARVRFSKAYAAFTKPKPVRRIERLCGRGEAQ